MKKLDFGTTRTALQGGVRALKTAWSHHKRSLALVLWKQQGKEEQEEKLSSDWEFQAFFE